MLDEIVDYVKFLRLQVKVEYPIFHLGFIIIYRSPGYLVFKLRFCLTHKV